MLDLNSLQQRINIEKAAQLIGLSIGRETVSRKTVYAWMNRGDFPRQLPTSNGAAVWDTEECLKKLGLRVNGKNDGK